MSKDPVAKEVSRKTVDADEAIDCYVMSQHRDQIVLRPEFWPQSKPVNMSMYLQNIA